MIPKRHYRADLLSPLYTPMHQWLTSCHAPLTMCCSHRRLPWWLLSSSTPGQSSSSLWRRRPCSFRCFLAGYAQILWTYSTLREVLRTANINNSQRKAIMIMHLCCCCWIVQECWPSLAPQQQQRQQSTSSWQRWRSCIH